MVILNVGPLKNLKISQGHAEADLERKIKEQGRGQPEQRHRDAINRAFVEGLLSNL